MSIAGIYTRKSKFTAKGESIQNQLELCTQYAKERGIEIKSEYVYKDEGYSGGSADRPAFQQMLIDAQNKKFDILICYRLDRISRSIVDFASLMDMLQEYGISFVSIREQFDTSTPIGRAMMYIASVFAQLERETTAERIRDNMRQLARTGRWLGGTTPTGFSSEPIIYYDADMKERKMYKLAPIKDEMEIVKAIYSKYLEFKSLSQVERWCIQNYLKSKNGKNFYKHTIRLILRNPVYAIAEPELYDYFDSAGVDLANDREDFDSIHGVLAYNRAIVKKGHSVKLRDMSEWIIAIGKHKGIIPAKEWIEVQKLLDVNKEKAPRQGTSEIALLSGLIRCGKCNSPMKVRYGQVNKATGQRYHYYVCSLKEVSKNVRCSNTPLSGLQVDSLVIDKIKELISDKQGILKQLDAMEAELMQAEKQQNERINQISDQISANEKAIQNLVQHLADNKDSIAAKYIVSQIEQLEQKNMELKEQLVQNTSQNGNVEKVDINIIREMLRNFNSLIDDADMIEKKRLVSSVVNNVVWDGNNLEINLLGSKKK